MEKNLELLSALLKGAQVTIYQLNAGDGQQTLHLAPEAKAAREAGTISLEEFTAWLKNS